MSDIAAKPAGRRGRTLKLYLVDGTPSGVITAELGVSSVRAAVASRTSLPELIKREEAGRTGIYLLVGPDPNLPGRQLVYIGEGDQVRTRLTVHDADETKEFFTRAVLFAALLDRLCTPFHSVMSLPPGWSKVTLQEVAKVRTGVAKNSRDSLRRPAKLPYLRVANVQDGYLNLSEIKEIEIEEADIPRYLLAQGDVLLTEGGDFDKLGRGYVWRGEISPCLHQNHVFSVRPDQNLIIPDYLSAYCSSRRAKRYLLSCSKQTTNLASVNSSQIKEMPLILPPLKEQRDIVAALSAWDGQVEKTQNFLDSLRRQRQGLLQKLLTGERRLDKHIGKPARLRISAST